MMLFPLHLISCFSPKDYCKPRLLSRRAKAVIRKVQNLLLKPVFGCDIHVFFYLGFLRRDLYCNAMNSVYTNRK